jgi:hypothetical protein
MCRSSCANRVTRCLPARVESTMILSRVKSLDEILVTAQKSRR